MKKIAKGILFVLVICFIFSIFIGCTKKTSSKISNKLMIAVSIVPEETFVRAVAGDLVDIVTMIPPGNSPANYAPTPKQMSEFNKAELYFTIGVPTEEANILPKAKNLNSNLKIISLADKVREIYPDRYFEKNIDLGRDPHIWLSLKRVKVMVEAIAKELSQIDGKNKSIYETNAKKYIKKIEKLDNEIKDSLTNLNNKTFIVYHPSFGYFADDYGLKMISLEKNGKEPTGKELQEVIEKAKKENIKVIFYQAEIDSKQTKVFAQEIGGKSEKIVPLAPNYIENLEKIAKTFKVILE